jgi:hypothetical protein
VQVNGIDDIPVDVLHAGLRQSAADDPHRRGGN